MSHKNEHSHPSVAWAGLDVSKQTFEAALARPGQNAQTPGLVALPAREFPRTPAGADAFIRWLDAQLEDSPTDTAARCVMEATGRYSTELAVWLMDRHPALAPAIEQPRLTAAYLRSLGLRNMTDKLAARGLALYGLERRPRAYDPPSPEELELREVCRWRDALVRQRTAAANRAAETTSSPFVARMQRKRIRHLDGDIARTEAQMRRLVVQSPQLRDDVKLLCTIYSVGFLSAVVVRAELGDLRRFDRARQLSAFAGANPAIHQSGTSVHKRTCLSKKGNTRVRQALYLCAMVAIQGDNDLRRTYRRLLDNGKPPMAALGAVMRKLLCLMRAVLISGKPYDPHRNHRGNLAHASP